MRIYLVTYFDSNGDFDEESDRYVVGAFTSREKALDCARRTVEENYPFHNAVTQKIVEFQLEAQSNDFLTFGMDVEVGNLRIESVDVTVG